jgi:hypothetical protein
MTLRVKFYSYSDAPPPSEEVGEVRWTTGGKVEVVSGGPGLVEMMALPIMVRGHDGRLRQVTAERDPEAFMRGVGKAYAGHFYGGPTVEF